MCKSRENDINIYYANQQLRSTIGEIINSSSHVSTKQHNVNTAYPVSVPS